MIQRAAVVALLAAATVLLATRTGDVATVITGLSLGGAGDDSFDQLAEAVAGRQDG